MDSSTKNEHVAFSLYLHRPTATDPGLMMAHILEISDERALKHACDLGAAMQLTNIARDIKSDFERGRYTFLEIFCALMVSTKMTYWLLRRSTSSCSLPKRYCGRLTNIITLVTKGLFISAGDRLLPLAVVAKFRYNWAPNGL